MNFKKSILQICKTLKNKIGNTDFSNPVHSSFNKLSSSFEFFSCSGVINMLNLSMKWYDDKMIKWYNLCNSVIEGEFCETFQGFWIMGKA